MIKKMSGKELKNYLKIMGLKLEYGKKTTTFYSLSSIPDNIEGFFDPDTKEFDIANGDIIIVAHFIGGASEDTEVDIPIKSTKPTKTKSSQRSSYQSYGCSSIVSSC